MRITANNRLYVSLIILALLVSLFAGSCTDSRDANSNNGNQAGNVNAKHSNPVKDNAEELAALIKLPVLPEEKNDERVEWREETVNQKGRKLTAIIKYNEANTAQIIALAEKHKPAVPVELGVEDWYPEELTAQTQLSGNESLKATAYAANDFVNPPYSHGRLVRINESNFFVLELTTY
jgi:hypothetical protein